jgi:hypothetical protein
VFIACAAVFLTWLHCAWSNLPALNPDSLYTAKGVVVGWFIPFYNLVHGYRSVKDLYVASQRPAGDETDLRPPRGAPIVGLWWGFYLARGFTDWYARHNPESETLVVSELSSIIAAILCIVVVYRIERRQRDQYNDLALRAAAATPPPSDRLR